MTDKPFKLTVPEKPQKPTTTKIGGWTGKAEKCSNPDCKHEVKCKGCTGNCGGHAGGREG